MPLDITRGTNEKKAEDDDRTVRLEVYPRDPKDIQTVGGADSRSVGAEDGFASYKAVLLGKVDMLHARLRQIFPIEMHLQTLEQMLGATIYTYVKSDKELEHPAEQAVRETLHELMDLAFGYECGPDNFLAVVDRQIHKTKEMGGDADKKENVLGLLGAHQDLYELMVSRKRRAVVANTAKAGAEELKRG